MVLRGTGQPPAEALRRRLNLPPGGTGLKIGRIFFSINRDFRPRRSPSRSRMAIATVPSPFFPISNLIGHSTLELLSAGEQNTLRNGVIVDGGATSKRATLRRASRRATVWQVQRHGQLPLVARVVGCGGADARFIAIIRATAYLDRNARKMQMLT